MIKALVFDFGGIFAIPGGTKMLRKKYALLLNVPQFKFDIAWHKSWDSWRKGMISETEFWDRVLGFLNINYDRKKLRRMMLDYHKISKERLAFAKRLRERYRVAVLTNHVREWFEFIRKKHQLKNYFDKIFTSYEFGIAKPSPKIYKVIAGKIGAKPGECVFVDDKFSNVLGARAAGMRAIHFKKFSLMKKELKKLGVEF